jgi:hypothetical protein
MPGIKLNYAFLEDFYIKVGALNKIKDISWILDYFRTRPDDLVTALEVRYQVVFTKDGNFVREQTRMPASGGVGAPAAARATYQDVRNDEFVRDLARASGVQARNVQAVFATQTPPPPGMGMGKMNTPNGGGLGQAGGDETLRTAVFDYEF